jgi:hypothetical protein
MKENIILQPLLARLLCGLGRIKSRMKIFANIAACSHVFMV